MDWEKYIDEHVTYTEHTKLVSVLGIDDDGEIEKVDVLLETKESIGRRFFTCLLCNKKIKVHPKNEIMSEEKIRRHFEKAHL